MVVVAVVTTVRVRVRLQLGVTVPVGVAEVVVVGWVVPDTIDENLRLTVAVPDVVPLTLPKGTTAGVLVPLGVCVRDGSCRSYCSPSTPSTTDRPADGARV